jgi:hypoxanthine phosphoribosyltransferase
MLVCTLKGACPFFQHLCDAMQELRQGYDIEFVRASSYDGARTSGQVSIFRKELTKVFNVLRNRHVILVEDIVDTGTTLATLLPLILQQGHPASLQVCTLLDKRLTEEPGIGVPTVGPHGLEKHFNAKYVGFSIPNFFIVGYGLDYNELYRDVSFACDACNSIMLIGSYVG